MSFPADALTAINKIKTTIAAAGPLQGASVATLTPIINAALAAQTIIEADIAALEPVLNTSSNDGADPTILSAWLLTVGAASSDQGNLTFADGYVGRLALNLNVGGS